MTTDGGEKLHPKFIPKTIQLCAEFIEKLHKTQHFAVLYGIGNFPVCRHYGLYYY